MDIKNLKQIMNLKSSWKCVAKKQLTLITPEHNPLKGRVIVQIRSSQVTGLCGRAIP
jgi:hypothetical protein